VAAISPYIETRDAVRELIGDNFVEVFVATSLEECERRDIKGLYAKARSGEIKEFTGISDPYEPPVDPEIIVHTENRTPQQSADDVIIRLEELGFIAREPEEAVA
jgi:adenylylsulfate kinase